MAPALASFYALGAKRNGSLYHRSLAGRAAADRAAPARGFDAVWCSRFPIGPQPERLDASVEFDLAWHEHARDRRYVSLCIFIVDAVERDRRAAQLGAFHDHVVAQ